MSLSPRKFECRRESQTAGTGDLQSGSSTNQSVEFADDAPDGNGGAGALYVDVFSHLSKLDRYIRGSSKVSNKRIDQIRVQVKS